MPSQISLNGDDWSFKDYYGEDWRWRDAHQPVSRDARFWRPGRVPGCVHADLWRAGAIPNPYFERNSLLLEWIPARTWVYRKTFQIDPALRGQRARLVFEGVDYEAEFFLNGESLGTHTGLYTPAAFEVDNRLAYGADNTLAVVIQPAPHEQSQVGRTSRVRTHKSRMTYWWDFCPRMIHMGIWQAVHLDVTGPTRIADVFVRPQLAPNNQRANISISVELDTIRAQEAEIEAVLRLDGNPVASARARHAPPPGQTQIDLSLLVEGPRLWWPNGSGDQPLYTAEVRVLDAATGDLCDTRVTRFGFRRVALLPNEAADLAARPYTFAVNGRKLYAKGWNWVPLDVMYGAADPTKLNRLLELARRAHVNLLRVWGGGLIETEAFYDHCDELGILVWQEFIQSSSGIDNVPPDAPDFIEFMAREAERIIPRKRNHPALAVWCGGNELMAGGEAAGLDRPCEDDHPLLAALKAAVARLDPGRAWLPTSPSGRQFSYSLANIARDPDGQHDVHGPWEYQGVEGQSSLYNQGTSLLHSEFGVEGLTNLKTLETTIGTENRWPVTLDSPIWHHLGAWWIHQPMWQAAFGEVTDLGEVDNLAALVRATQLMQAEGLRYALEADRRRKYHNSGTLPWQFNEPYPMAACTSAVDYYARPKPAYYAVTRAYAPLLISARFPTLAWAGRESLEVEVWANHSAETPLLDTHLTAQIVGLDGSAFAEWQQSASIPANAALRLAALTYPLATIDNPVFFLDLALDDGQGQRLAANRYIFTRAGNLAPLLAVPPTALDVRQEERGDSWVLTLTNTGPLAALFVWLEDGRPLDASGGVYFEDNHVCLFPGETRRLAVDWQAVPVTERRIEINGWNFERISLP